MASASDDHVSDDADDEDEDDNESDPSDDPSNPDAYDTDEERECWNKKELALSGCLYDVPAPVTFSISRAYQLLEIKTFSDTEHLTHSSPELSQRAIIFLNDLYHDESALRDRTSMVYVCSVIMTYLYHLCRICLRG